MVEEVEGPPSLPPSLRFGGQRKLRRSKAEGVEEVEWGRVERES
jgi:hypothetical protein